MIKLFSHIDPSWYDTSPFLQSLLEERWQDGITHHFLQYFFHQSFPGVYPSPKEQIPPHPLGMLADATKPELESLLFYLGLYDLAAEQKMILDGSILRAIEKALTPEERLFMKEITPHSLGLMGIAKSPSQVRSLVLRRGIERLSYGLADAPPDLVWYILHTLDKATAEMMKPAPRVKFTEQILTTWNRRCS